MSLSLGIVMSRNSLCGLSKITTYCVPPFSNFSQGWPSFLASAMALKPFLSPKYFYFFFVFRHMLLEYKDF